MYVGDLVYIKHEGWCLVSAIFPDIVTLINVENYRRIYANKEFVYTTKSFISEPQEHTHYLVASDEVCRLNMGQQFIYCDINAASMYKTDVMSVGRLIEVSKTAVIINEKGLLQEIRNRMVFTYGRQI